VWWFIEMGLWYSRPVLFVADVQRALNFYVGKLGFTEKWKFAEDGSVFVAQVDRDECEIIFSSQWPEKNGKGMLFIELLPADYAALPGDFAKNGVTAKQGWWGYRTLIVADPDGNELYFPDPTDPGGANSAASG
jgi:catechol 2,3-dioxygenase-like lactoylglutathione lyase family enzyme